MNWKMNPELMSVNLTEIASEFYRERNAMIESQLIRRIEEVLGRVPSDREVAKFGMRFVSSSNPQAEDYYWKDTFLFGVWTGFSPPMCRCYFDAPVIKRAV